jgi:2,4-dienoyl-CoA reductase-like NADH-dependent reductase (Old Yellow Enzyme family)
MTNQIPRLSAPLVLDDLKLKNRIFLSSLTRDRNVTGLMEPDALNVEYYRQRASAGLIFSEGLLVSPQGTEWTYAPGLWAPRQIAAWSKVTEAVHSEGSFIFAQLWHVGRVAHPLLQSGIPVPGPSAIAAKGGKFRQLDGCISPKE